MNRNALGWLGHSLAVVTVALLMGCARETPVGPASLPLGDSPAAAVAPDLSACPTLQPDAGSELALRVYAKGVQVYLWSGTAWVLDGPDALLYAEPDGKGLVGTHYKGPTWETMSGGKVVGAVIERCTPNPNAIQWLKLGAVYNKGPGIFDQVAFILRVNTVGGKAPATPGSFIGEEVRIPYSTEYFFYRGP